MAKLVYGPVPSRRLGRSLGVDLVPYKVCTYDCVYCQLGPTRGTTVERKPYVDESTLLDQIEAKLLQDVRADYITLAGSGEPTLNSHIGSVIAAIKRRTQVPVAVLTNGSLLADGQVRASLLHADVVLPSLDAHDPKGFQAINRPHGAITFEAMTGGLIAFRKEYTGKIWLEIFLVPTMNDSEEDAAGFRKWVDAMNPDKVHLNTAVRPAAESWVRQVSGQVLDRFCEILGPRAEVIVPFRGSGQGRGKDDLAQDILSILARRPCTLEDICSGLGVPANEAIKQLEALVQGGFLETMNRGPALFYRPRKAPVAR